MSRKNRNVAEYWETQKPVVSQSSFKTQKHIKPLTASQKAFIKSIKNKSVVFGLGCAGTGKTLVALYTAIQLVNNEYYPYENIVYVRANIGVRDEREVGILPGGLNEKLLHLTYPIIDSLCEFMAKGDAEAAIRDIKIEVLPVSLLRGRSLNKSIVICDEVQNLSFEGVRTLLTRLGKDSKMILIGDPQQSDMDSRRKVHIERVVDLLSKSEDVDSVYFNEKDIVRNGVIAEMLSLLSGYYNPHLAIA